MESNKWHESPGLVVLMVFIIAITIIILSHQEDQQRLEQRKIESDRKYKLDSIKAVNYGKSI